jgi:hypothetical protein
MVNGGVAEAAKRKRIGTESEGEAQRGKLSRAVSGYKPSAAASASLPEGTVGSQQDGAVDLCYAKLPAECLDLSAARCKV